MPDGTKPLPEPMLNNQWRLVAFIWGESPRRAHIFSPWYVFLNSLPHLPDATGPGEFPTQRPVTRSFDVHFDLCLDKRSSDQSWSWWFETPSRSLWRHCNELITTSRKQITRINIKSHIHSQTTTIDNHLDDWTELLVSFENTRDDIKDFVRTRWRHQMETFSALLALCEGNPPVTGGFP